jgi:NMD protein affecting ribosome stability and mRNA decay
MKKHKKLLFLFKIMVNSDYFEGILQLRNVTDEVVKFAVHEIESRKDSNISKLKKVKNGVDIYMAPQRFLRSLGIKLQGKFGGQLITSKRLHTRNRLTSRDVYRVNLLFRMASFKKGDVIEYKGDKIKIVAMNKQVLAKDFATGKKLNLRFKDLLD